MAKAWAVNAGKAATAVGTATIAASTDLFTITSHGLSDGDRVAVDTLTGGAVGVLVEDGVYWVRDATTHTFALTLTLLGAPVEFTVDGGADVYRWTPPYDARELRRVAAMHLYPGSSDRFGAREGVRPTGQAVVSAAGTTWTQHDLTAVVYPGLTGTSGPYEVEKVEESGSFDPADGTNPRIDALDLLVEDDDEDASGDRQVTVAYVAGTPAGSPSEPTLTTNAFRIGTFDVPAGGAPSPTVRSQAEWTVAAGGILPIDDDDSAPSTGVYEGAYVDQDDALQRHDGTGFLPVASPNSPTMVRFTANGTFTKADYPWARRGLWRVQGPGGGGGGCAATGAGEAAAAGGAQGGDYVEAIIEMADLGANETVTVPAGGAGGSAGANNGATASAASVGTHLVAAGGVGGQGAAGGSGVLQADGGTGSSGSAVNTGVGFIVPGGDGHNGRRDSALVLHQGHGGDSVLGKGARTHPNNSGGSGQNGGAPGGGGSGSFLDESTSAAAGGAGGRAEVIVVIY
jgi:hypothetical protein